MKTSARNQLAGTVTAVRPGAVNDEVELALASGGKVGTKVVAIITHASTVALGLKPQAGATALIKDGKKPDLFDLGIAHDLYARLLIPIEPLIKDKRHLIFVPTGPLTALPFHLLVTDKPARAKPAIGEISAYRDAAWLIKRHAITVIPSVASLKALGLDLLAGEDALRLQLPAGVDLGELGVLLAEVRLRDRAERLEVPASRFRRSRRSERRSIVRNVLANDWTPDKSPAQPGPHRRSTHPPPAFR